MRFVLFYHSLVSDWNHGNAHFLRGVARELQAAGHDVSIYEPAGGWSRANLVAEQGEGPVRDFETTFPTLRSETYAPADPDLDRLLDGADVVIVHEWSEHALVEAIGRHRARRGGYTLLFHDTHHRCVTAADEMRRYDLSEYDGVLAYGRVIRDVYLGEGWARRAWTWHEAADTGLFRPLPEIEKAGDLVWIGNWGDGERSRELIDYFVDPVRALGLKATAFGVRYPEEGLRALREAGIGFAGWCANQRVPEIFARHRCTLHLPRRPYREQLAGIPTIRVFEALACGIPLVCLDWDDAEGLFTPGEDYLVADTPAEMTDCLRAVLSDEALAGRLRAHGLETIRRRHTCRHRVEELLAIVRDLRRPSAASRHTPGAITP